MTYLHPTSNFFLNGEHFVIGTLHLPPFISYTNVSSNGHINDINGFIHQIMLYMAVKYQLSFDYVKSSDGAYGSLFENGSWNGLVGMLQRNEVDLIAACLVVTGPRSTAVGFSVPFYNDPVSLLIPYPTFDSSINGIARPFQCQVWILIIASFVIMAFTFWKLISIELWIFDVARNLPRPSLFKSFWSLIYIYRMVHVRIENHSRLPVRLLAAVWCLSVFVLVTAYSSTLTSYLMTPRYHPMVNSIKDIAAIQRPIFMVSKFTSYESTILDAKEGVLVKIAESIKNHPELRLNGSRDIAIQSVIKYERSFTTVKSSLLDSMEKDFKKSGQCRLYLAKEPWDTARAALALRKSSHITTIFNRQINWLREVGLLNHWERAYWPRKNRCSEPLINSRPKHISTKLTLDALSSAFLLLACGLLLSFLVFLIEKYLFYRSINRNN